MTVMQRRLLTIAAMLLGGILFTPTPADAQQDRLCGDVCRPGTPTENGSACNESCGVCRQWGHDGSGNPVCVDAYWSTCGTDGVCDSCPSSWAEAGRVQVGGYQKNWYTYCEYWVVYDVYEFDVNGCRPNRTRCDEALDARLWGLDVNCCFVSGQCYGKQSC